MKWIIISLLLLVSSASAETRRVAIIDTGIDVKDPRFQRLICGYKDFTGKGITDTIGHGTHVAGLIKKYAGNKDYCFLIYKYYDKYAPPYQTNQRILLAFRQSVLDRANIVNYSGGGSVPLLEEYNIIGNSPKTTYIVAAGNNNSNIDNPEYAYYPASYGLPNIIPVGALSKQGFKLQSSNWGQNVFWELGDRVESTTPCVFEQGIFKCSGVMSGTSMATAIYSGKYIGSHYENNPKSN